MNPSSHAVPRQTSAQETASASAANGTAPAGLLTLDDQGRVVEINPAGASLLGLNQAQLIGRHLIECLDALSQPRALNFLASLAQGAEAQVCRVTLAGGSGKPRHLHLVGAGPPRQRLAILDITGWMQAEDTLRESEGKLHLFIEHVPVALAMFDRDMRYIAASRRWLSDFGLGEGQIVGRSHYEVFPELSEQIREVHRRGLAGEVFRERESSFLRANGQVQWLRWSLWPWYRADGSVGGVVIFSTDISQRKQALEELRAKQTTLKAVFEDAPYVTLLVDHRKLVVDINHAGVEFAGREKTELLGRLGGEVFQCLNSFDGEGCGRNLTCRDCPVRSRVEHTLATGESIYNAEGSLTVVHAGQPMQMDLLISTSLLQTGGETLVLVSMVDVSQLRRAEEEKARLENQLRQAQKMEAIGTLAGGIAHDFNNILATILGYAEIARDDARRARVDPHDLEQIITAASRAKDLVSQILTFSRKSSALFKPLNLNHKVRAVAEMLRRMLPKDIVVDLSLALDDPLINGDVGQVEQVLMNLATNARDAMPEGGRLLMETALVHLDDEFCGRHLAMLPGDHVLLRVSDSGQGMDQTTMIQMYDPFFTTKEVGKGTGLGLSTVHGIVKIHGGHIFCDSAPGQGTAFSIYLPALPLRGRASLEGKGEGGPAPAGREGAILVVDDEEALRQLAAKNLAAQGYRVSSAASGEEAVEAYRQGWRDLDLVILDLGMPGMGGEKCLAALREINPQAKVLIASGYAQQTQVARAMAAGATDFLAKPFKREELLEMVHRLL